MALPIISADQRLAEHRGIKGCIFGKSGVGKTSLIKTLDPKTTLFFDLEAGDLAIGDWPVDTIRPQTWEECRDFALFIGGANLTHTKDQPYSLQRYKTVCQSTHYGDPACLQRYETVFIDSITVASRLCFQWCLTQPQSMSTSGKVDTRSAYGLLGQEMMSWLTHLQHTRHKNIWFVGILEQKTDDYNRRYYQPQIEGSKTSLELPGIVDEVITLTDLLGTIKDKNGKEQEKPYRAFICQTLNPYGYPAKDRSGQLDEIEEPHLGKLMDKLTKGKKYASGASQL